MKIIGGQVGGDCDRFNTTLLLSAHQIKYAIEAPHDLKGDRSDKSVYDGQTISAARMVDGTIENLYIKIEAVLKSFVKDLPEALFPNFEDKFIADLQRKIAAEKVDEDKYLSSIVDILTINCREVIDDFFFYNSIHFSLRDIVHNKISYNLLKVKIIETYPYPDWWMAADINTHAGVTDLYLYVIKREEARPLIDTTFKLYEQDMGLGEISDIAFREIDYNVAYKKLFPDGSTDDNNIDLFFENDTPYAASSIPKLKASYKDAIVIARNKNKNGEIKVTNGKLIATATCLIDTAKSFDPLSVEHPGYGDIFGKGVKLTITTDSINGFNKLYIGYPNTTPIVLNGGPPLEQSITFFNSNVDALGTTDVPVVLNPLITGFLKDLNLISAVSTVEVFNTLLQFWINTPNIIRNYRLILKKENDTHEIIGFKFYNEDESFTFTAHIADCTVTNICYAIIVCANRWNEVEASLRLVNENYLNDRFEEEDTPQNRIIQQMINIMNHPNFILSKSDLDLSQRFNYALTIIATIKSFGDESQILSKSKLQEWSNLNVNLDKSSKNIFLKSSDRPLIGHLLLYLQSFIAELLVPHRSFGQQEEIKDKIPTQFNTITNAPVTIYNVNSSLISNKKSIITSTKSTFERLLETPIEFLAAYNLLKAKLDLPNLPDDLPDNLQGYWSDAQGLNEVLRSEPPNFIAMYFQIKDIVSNLNRNWTNNDEYEADADNVKKNGLVEAANADFVAAEIDLAETREGERIKQRGRKGIEEGKGMEEMEQIETHKDDDNIVVKKAITVKRAELNKGTDVEKLNRCRKYIGEIKQLFTSLEYYKKIPDMNMKEGNKNKLITSYLDSQIKTAVSNSIPSVILTDIKVFNNKHGIAKIKDITNALNNMYNNLDFYSRIFDLHDIACELFIKKLQNYIVIIDISSLSDAKKTEIKGHYESLIHDVTTINDKFVEDAKTKLEKEIGNREVKASRGRETKNLSSVNAAAEGTSSVEIEAQQASHAKNILDQQTTADKLKSDIANATAALESAKAKVAIATAYYTTAKDAAAAAKGDGKGAANDFKKNKKTELDAVTQEEKTLKAELTQLKKQKISSDATFAGFIKFSSKLAEKMNIAVLTAMSSSHSAAKNAMSDLQTMLGNIGKRMHNATASKGGKRSIQNKQRYQKKYTKRLRKKIYRKKTLKRFKIKRPKKTKKHRGK